ncbi:MAG: tetratricopeptide repeat protein [Nitrospirae bacterium]|nr:tetratricopeptide repeat protein [Nitrospirota bacterium]
MALKEITRNKGRKKVKKKGSLAKLLAKILLVSALSVLVLSSLVYTGALILKMVKYRHAVSLTQKALDFYKSGQYPEAESTCKTAITLNDDEFRKYNRSLEWDKDRIDAYYENLVASLAEKPVFNRIFAFYDRHEGPRRVNLSGKLVRICSYVDRGIHSLAARNPFRWFSDFYNSDLNRYRLNKALNLNNLGSIYMASKRYTEAESALRQSISIYDEVLGTGHPQSATALQNLASLYKIKGRPEPGKHLAGKNPQTGHNRH